MTEEEKEAMNVLFHLAHINTYLDLDTKNVHKISTDIIKIWKNASSVILNLIQKLQEENNNKDKIIDLMAKDLLTCGFDYIDFGKLTGNFKEDKEKLKQYFEKQAKEV